MDPYSVAEHYRKLHRSYSVVYLPAGETINCQSAESASALASQLNRAYWLGRESIITSLGLDIER